MLVGNKRDKASERKVSEEEGKVLARLLGCQFIETSAKTAQNVEQVFTGLIRTLRQTRDIELPYTAPRAGQEQKRKKCVIL